MLNDVVAERAELGRQGFPVIDCDIHPAVQGGFASVLQYMPAAWARRLASRNPVHIDNPQWTVRFPHPNSQSRPQAIPPGGGAPASDPAFVATDFLDKHRIERALLLPLQAAAVSAWSDPLEATQLVSAYNRFYAESWLASDDRYRLAMCVAPQDPERAAAEIRSFGCTKGVAAVWVGMLNVLLGDSHYRPMLAAAHELGLPIVLHSTGTEGLFQGSPTIAGGIPTGFNERRILAPQVHQSNLVSLVFQGTFDRFPDLKVLFVECGWAWLPALLWRMDVSWRAAPNRGALGQEAAIGVRRRPRSLHHPAVRGAGEARADPPDLRHDPRRADARLQLRLPALGHRWPRAGPWEASRRYSEQGRPRERQGDVRISPRLTQRRAVGKRADFPTDSITIVEVEGREVGMIDCSGELYAVLNVCPHQLGPVCRGDVGGTMLPSAPDELRYGLEGKVIRCPWHFWEFDLMTGKPLFGISRSRLLTFPVHVEDGEVLIEMTERRR